MKKITTSASLLALVGLLSGCTSTGPMVADVALGKNNTLIVAKCEVKNASFIGLGSVVYKDKCYSETVELPPTNTYTHKWTDKPLPQ